MSRGSGRVRSRLGGAVLPAALAAVAAIVVATPAGADGSGTTTPVRSCATLAAVAFTDGTRVTSVADVPASDVAPSYCQVTLTVPDRITVVVGLPKENWNGRYQALGTGGFAGTVVPSSLPLSGPQAIPATVAQGYVVSASDAGHQASNLSGAWAWSPTGLNWPQIRDYGYRATHEMAVKSKVLIDYFYGQQASFSYYNGCSNGGREGITEAMRYPSDFDGIFAGDPATDVTRLAPALLWPVVVMNQEHDFIPVCKQQAVQEAVMQACDGTGDGAKDGLFDPRVCNFDPGRLLGLRTPCGVITQQDVDVLEKIWNGPRRSDGSFLWFGLYAGSNLGGEVNWTLAPTLSLPGSDQGFDAVPFSIAEDWFKYFIYEDPTWNWRTLTYRQFEQAFDTGVAKFADVLSTDGLSLAQFRARGGKIVVYQGLNDQIIPPAGVIHFYDNVVVKQAGGIAKARDFARLFLSPNAAHCAPVPAAFDVGTGAFPDDPMVELRRWREDGVAPAGLAASGVNPAGRAFTRNLCPHPQRMQYQGTGDIYDASSFRCTSGLGGT